MTVVGSYVISVQSIAPFLFLVHLDILSDYRDPADRGNGESRGGEWIGRGLLVNPGLFFTNMK